MYTIINISKTIRKYEIFKNNKTTELLDLYSKFSKNNINDAYICFENGFNKKILSLIRYKNGSTFKVKLPQVKLFIFMIERFGIESVNNMSFDTIDIQKYINLAVSDKQNFNKNSAHLPQNLINKYKKWLDYSIVYEIFKTFDSNGLKKYSNWYLSFVKNDISKLINSDNDSFDNIMSIKKRYLEDAPKTIENLKIFTKPKIKAYLKSNNFIYDINKVNGINDLFEILDTSGVLENENTILNKDELIKKRTVKKFDDCIIVEATTPEESKIFGSGTNWCTAGSDNGNTQFNHYTDNGKKPLVIIITDDGNKYQYAPHTGDFLEKNDNEFEFTSVFDEEVYQFLNKQYDYVNFDVGIESVESTDDLIQLINDVNELTDLTSFSNYSSYHQLDEIFSIIHFDDSNKELIDVTSSLLVELINLYPDDSKIKLNFLTKIINHNRVNLFNAVLQDFDWSEKQSDDDFKNSLIEKLMGNYNFGLNSVKNAFNYNVIDLTDVCEYFAIDIDINEYINYFFDKSDSEAVDEALQNIWGNITMQSQNRNKDKIIELAKYGFDWEYYDFIHFAIENYQEQNTLLNILRIYDYNKNNNTIEGLFVNCVIDDDNDIMEIKTNELTGEYEQYIDDAVEEMIKVVKENNLVNKNTKILIPEKV